MERKKFTPPRKTAGIYLLILSLVLIVSCQGEEAQKNEAKANQPALTNEEIKRLVLLNADFTYPEADARKNAESLASQLLTPSDKIPRTVSNIITLPSYYSLKGSTRIKTDAAIAKPQTPSLYIANFAGGLGYIILSADKRITDIVGVAARGTIDSLVYDPGMQIFLSNAITSMDEKVAAVEALREDGTFKSMVEKLDLARTKKIAASNATGRIGECESIGSATKNCGVDCYYESDVISTNTVNNVNTTVAPLLNTAWYQGPPYNDYGNGYNCDCVDEGGSQAGIGICNDKGLQNCWLESMAVAEGQVVAFYRAKNNPAWQTTNSRICGQYDISDRYYFTKLLYDINVLYWDIAKDNPSCGINAFDWRKLKNENNGWYNRPRGISSSFGFVEGEWRDRNDDDTQASLANGSPVLIKGTSQLCRFLWWSWGCGDGFEWVIDGLRTVSTTTTTTYRAYYTGTECTDDEASYSNTYTYSYTSPTTTQVHNNWGTSPTSISWNNITYFSSYGHETRMVAFITPL